MGLCAYGAAGRLEISRDGFDTFKRLPKETWAERESPACLGSSCPTSQASLDALSVGCATGTSARMAFSSGSWTEMMYYEEILTCATQRYIFEALEVPRRLLVPPRARETIGVAHVRLSFVEQLMDALWNRVEARPRSVECLSTTSTALSRARLSSFLSVWASRPQQHCSAGAAHSFLLLLEHLPATCVLNLGLTSQPCWLPDKLVTSHHCLLTG